MDSSQSKNLIKSKNYKDVIRYYSDDSSKLKSEWDYYYYSLALWKEKDYQKGRLISREGIMKYPTFEMVRSPYCWCLYYLYVKGFDGSNELDFKRAVESILKYSKQEAYTPYERTIWKMVDWLKSKTGIHAENIDFYLSLMNPSMLSNQPYTVEINGRTQEIESKREKWYSLKSSVLLRKKDYEGCISICQEALSLFQKLHHDNDIWFQYRSAVAHMELGNLEKAKNDFNKILIYKEHWIIYYCLFRIYVLQKKNNDAIRMASSAMLSGGEYKSKVKLLEEFADMLKDVGFTEEAFYHLSFAVKLREENNWKIKELLLNNLKLYNKLSLDTKELLSKLRAFWISNRHIGKIKYYGRIESLLSNNKAGFIISDKGEKYYFRFSGKQVSRYTIGSSVEFYIKDSFDKKKNRMSKEAIDVKVVKTDG